MKEKIEEIVGKIESGHLEPEDAVSKLIALFNDKQQRERLCDKNEYGKINKLYIRVGDEWIPYNEQHK
jgi:hypothetical protein